MFQLAGLQHLLRCKNTISSGCFSCSEHFMMDSVLYFQTEAGLSCHDFIISNVISTPDVDDYFLLEKIFHRLLALERLNSGLYNLYTFQDYTYAHLRQRISPNNLIVSNVFGSYTTIHFSKSWKA